MRPVAPAHRIVTDEGELASYQSGGGFGRVVSRFAGSQTKSRLVGLVGAPQARIVSRIRRLVTEAL